jgi:GTPase SAR1 family protein
MATNKQPLSIILLGAPGAGKSTWLRKYIRTMQIQYNRRALIVSPHDGEHTDVPLRNLADPAAFGFKKVIRSIYDKETTIKQINRHLTDCILVFDDCRNYLSSAITDEFHELMISRRQRNIETITVAHGFTEVPPKVFTFSTHIALHRTTDNIKRRKDVILNYPRMVEAQKEVNKIALKNPHYCAVVPQL